MAALVKGREKRPYSIFRKMQRKAIGFEQLSDIYGFRVTVGTVEACYRVLGVIHTTWPTVPGRFKDYISTPKQNDYKSIHTTIVGRRVSVWNCRSGPFPWIGWPNTVSPHTRFTRTANSADAISPGIRKIDLYSYVV